MTYSAPRRTGRRFIRPARQAASKRKRTEQGSSPAYSPIRERIDSSELLARTLTGLQNLGSQRFPLRPYSDHFERWTRNLRLILAEFEAEYLPNGNPGYESKRQQIVAALQDGLEQKKRIEQQSEHSLAKMRTELESARRKLDDAEARFKDGLGRLEIQRKRKVGLLKGEVDVLKRKRSQTHKPSLLDRLLGRKKRHDADFDKVIESKTVEMQDASMSLDDQARQLEREHAEQASSLKAELERLTSELETMETQTSADDALELRHTACKALNELIQETATRRSAAGANESSSPDTFSELHH